MSIIISICFLLYFLILFFERTQSIVKVVLDGGLFSGGFEIYVNLISILSLLATVILLAFYNREFWASIFKNKPISDYTNIVITAGVILISGMVHTENTVAPIQFGAYGVLILAMILHTVKAAPSYAHPMCAWYSLIFLTAFSMAIPVMYKSEIKLHLLFHVIEAIVAIALVFWFTYMMRMLFTGQGSNLLLWVPMLIAAVGDSIILSLRWKEEVNSFVLIFIIASTVLFSVGKVIFSVIDK